jgi:hypothetical protein
VTITPASNVREGVSVGIFGVATTFAFDLDWEVADPTTFALYNGNEVLYNYLASDPAVQLVAKSDATRVVLPLSVPQAALTSYLLTITTGDRILTHKVWAITPQILKGMHTLEEFLNKARIEDTIPELQYTQADLLNYLERGLNLFNMLGKATTTFTGTNMVGHLFNAWITCSARCAVEAQLIAEQALAFSFSGQSVSLEVVLTVKSTTKSFPTKRCCSTVA